MNKGDKRVLMYFAKYMEQHGFNPTGRELLRVIPHLSQPFDNLRRLERAGYLERSGYGKRQITEKGRKYIAEHTFVWACPHCDGDVVL